jgi:hypothetical protein
VRGSQTIVWRYDQTVRIARKIYVGEICYVYMYSRAFLFTYLFIYTIYFTCEIIYLIICFHSGYLLRKSLVYSLPLSHSCSVAFKRAYSRYRTLFPTIAHFHCRLKVSVCTLFFFYYCMFTIYSRYIKRVISKRDGCEYLKQVPSINGSLELM